MGLRVIGDNVAIRRHQAEQASGGGIALPPQAIVSNNRGEVVAVGPAVRELRPGHVVLYSRWPGKAVTHEGETLLVMPEGGVFGILETPVITGDEVAGVLSAWLQRMERAAEVEA